MIMMIRIIKMMMIMIVMMITLMTNISAPGAQWQQQPTSTNSRSKYFQIPIVYDGSLDFLGIASFYGNFPDFVGSSPFLIFKSQLSMIIHNFNFKKFSCAGSSSCNGPWGLEWGSWPWGRDT